MLIGKEMMKMKIETVLYDVTDEDVENGVFVVPDGITAIGEWAFEKCKRLNKVVISNGVTSIRNQAFSFCESLQEVLIPNSVIVIDGSFQECNSLTHITIPGSVITLEENFDTCRRLESIDVDKSNPNYTSVDGVLFNKDKTTLLRHPNEKSEKSDKQYIIPDGVKTIGTRAFLGCSRLAEVIIPNSVKTITSLAFLGCKSLSSIIIPDSVTEIAESAFDKTKKLTVKCHKGSYAEKYMGKYGYRVEYLED